ncbi:MAG: DUF3089 domain-containing protein [Muribaculaceae bacterium]|nr:DUF3089 domain-containing protein [Muribaculaceae bacterium]
MVINIKRYIYNLCILYSIVFIASSCDTDTPEKTAEYVPPLTDYTNREMWVIYSHDTHDTGADVFYIPSTWEYDYIAANGKPCHYADPTLPAHRADMKTEIDQVAAYMADGNDFYSPYYRHISLDSWATLNEDTINRRYHDVAFVDVRNAFDYFISQRDNNRPFILAGFSQGGKSVVELLKILPEELRDKMVAAYVMGYKITPDDVVTAPWIKPACKADDTGVTVSYNSVSDVKYVKPIVAAPTVMCINPVNWRTDDTPAILNDTITVTLSPQYNVLVLKGFDGSSLPNILDILNVGDYHGAEPWLYSECLRENLKTRINSFRNKNQTVRHTEN